MNRLVHLVRAIQFELGGLAMRLRQHASSKGRVFRAPDGVVGLDGVQQPRAGTMLVPIRRPRVPELDRLVQGARR